MLLPLIRHAENRILDIEYCCLRHCRRRLPLFRLRLISASADERRAAYAHTPTLMFTTYARRATFDVFFRRHDSHDAADALLRHGMLVLYV